MSSEHRARMNVPASSSGDFLSSSQNDGNVKHTVTRAETTNGKIRSPNNRLAAFAAARLMFFAPRHTSTTSKDSGQYTVAKKARETRRPRAANITPVLPS